MTEQKDNTDPSQPERLDLVKFAENLLGYKTEGQGSYRSGFSSEEKSTEDEMGCEDRPEDDIVGQTQFELVKAIHDALQVLGSKETVRIVNKEFEDYNIEN